MANGHQTGSKKEPVMWGGWLLHQLVIGHNLPLNLLRIGNEFSLAQNEVLSTPHDGC